MRYSGIIKNDFYIGTLTLGKTKARSINGRQVPQSKENMYVFKNAHEAIVDEQTFKLSAIATSNIFRILINGTGNYAFSKVQDGEQLLVMPTYTALLEMQKFLPKKR